MSTIAPLGQSETGRHSFPADAAFPDLTLSGVSPGRTAEYLRLEASASEPYTRFVYGDRLRAERLHAKLFEAGTAEFAAPWGQLATLDGHAVGMFAALTGTELRKRRLQSSLTLASELRADGTGLRDRMQLAATTLLTVDPTDLYLSRIAVSADARGLGIGRHLLEIVDRIAREQECPRIVLEVSPEHAAAERLYRRAGYQQVDDRSVTCPVTGRRLHYLHLHKRVAS